MIKNLLITFLISMVPVIELRGAIPYGVANNVPVILSFFASIIGNMIPVPFILLFIRKIFAFLRTKSAWLEKLVSRLIEKADKDKDKVIKYEFWGLLLLVAIPLPGTGAWTGALVAAMLDMRMKKALPAIFTGVVIAGIVVSLATMGIISLV